MVTVASSARLADAANKPTNAKPCAHFIDFAKSSSRLIGWRSYAPVPTRASVAQSRGPLSRAFAISEYSVEIRRRTPPDLVDAKAGEAAVPGSA